MCQGASACWLVTVYLLVGDRVCHFDDVLRNFVEPNMTIFLLFTVENS
jgi:hypothetical protein